MKRTTFGIVIATSFLWASYSFAVFCPPVAGDNTENVNSCIAWAAATDKVVVFSYFDVFDSNKLALVKGDKIPEIIPTIYPISGQIVVLKGVALLGNGSLYGTEFDINFGENGDPNDRSQAAFLMNKGSAFKGITVVYPNQPCGKEMHPYSSTIAFVDWVDDITISGNFFPDSYQILLANAPHGRLYFTYNRIGVFWKIGYINQCFDIDHFDHNHQNPAMWDSPDDNSELFMWMYNNSIGLEVARVDWFWAIDFFTIMVKTGILLDNDPKFGATGEAHIIQGGCDACQYGIYSNVQSGGRPWLISIDDYSGTALDPSGKGSGVSIFIANVDNVNVNNGNFWGVRNEAIFLQNDFNVTVSGNHFSTDGWNQADNGSAAIRLKNCRNASISDNVGTNKLKTTKGVLVEDSSNIRVHDNGLDISGSSTIFTGSTSNSRSINNDGCTQGSGNVTNRADNWCSPSFVETPIPTPTPTRNPGDPTPTPTPTVLPTRIPKEKPGLPLK